MKLFINFLLVFASVGCNSEKKPADSGWDVTIKGKVNFPQEGAIQIQELKNSGAGVAEAITLNKDNTYSKTIHITEPGVFGINFYGKQSVNLMVDHSTIELNVDGNNQQGAVEIKGSPDHDLYQKNHLITGGFFILSELYLIIILIIKLEFNKMIISIRPKFDPLSIFSFPF